MSESDGDAYLIYDPDISSNSFFGEDGISAVAVRDELDPMDWNQWVELLASSLLSISIDKIYMIFYRID